MTVRWSWAAVALFVAMALGGCVDGQEDPGPVPDEAEVRPGGKDPLTFETEACVASALATTIDFATTDAILPQGFRALDASSLAFLPANTGSAAAVAALLDCAGGPEGDATQFLLIGILVDDPAVEGVVEGAMHSFYVTSAMTTDAALEDDLASMDWPLREVEGLQATVVLHAPTSDTTGPVLGREDRPAVGTSEGTEEGGGFWWGVFAGATYYLGGQPLRFWHEGTPGLGYLEMSTGSHALWGTAFCTMDEGTAWGELIGDTHCTEPDEDPDMADPAPGRASVGIVIPSTDISGSLHLLAGRAAA